MIKSYLTILTFIFGTISSLKIEAQKIIYKNQCELVKDLIDSADKHFFHFERYLFDSSICVIDVKLLLNECNISQFDKAKIKLIPSDPIHDTIKLSEVYTARKDDLNFFIVTREHSHEKIFFRIEHPKSGGIYYWQFIQYVNDERFYFKRKGSGWNEF